MFFTTQRRADADTPALEGSTSAFSLDAITRIRTVAANGSTQVQVDLAQAHYDFTVDGEHTLAKVLRALGLLASQRQRPFILFHVDDLEEQLALAEHDRGYVRG